ncbi:hypothetical protein FB472_1045 [Rhodoglobus vestalii]|uniref:Uncharacterized protein n=1 Tax=Rhodoglobus vestalii TaxID=193384 RepID=A0A8H2K634_9MICO|nr:hypothetical protein [Rhodoglobus vestalii]TQO19488.1 hypothetical protein FB472_1045 [Rhodoglobus vestalii]
MTLDYSLLLDVLVPLLAVSLGAYFSARLGVAHAERSEVSRFRRESAEELVVAFTTLRDLLRDVQHIRDVEQWIAAVNAAYDAIEDARYRTPSSFRHLKQSLRFALGEAVGGVSLADMRTSREHEELSEYNHRWNEYAIEYIEMVLGSIRQWRDAPVKTAPKVWLLAFDPWLAKTERYVSGQGIAEMT